MIPIRNFLTRKVLYLLSAFLFTIITLQIGISTQVRSDLAKPLPLVEAMACASGVHAYVTVIPNVANWSNVTLHDHELLFDGRANGGTPEEKIKSEIFVSDENGVTVPKNVSYQEIWTQVAFGDLSETSGLSAQEIIGLYREKGKSIPNARQIGRGAYLDDWYAPTYDAYSWCNGYLTNEDGASHSDVSEALYNPYFLIGGTVCDNAGTSS